MFRCILSVHLPCHNFLSLPHLTNTGLASCRPQSPGFFPVGKLQPVLALFQFWLWVIYILDSSVELLLASSYFVHSLLNTNLPVHLVYTL